MGNTQSIGDIQLSVIVPFYEKELLTKEFIETLSYLNEGNQIIFSANCLKSDIDTSLLKKIENRFSIDWLYLPNSNRAVAMNEGVNAAKFNYLWFLHADSQIDNLGVKQLYKNLINNEQLLYFFRLEFINKETFLTKLNTWGCIFRSEICRIPFGDQGFCLTKENFDKIGKYPENFDKGEDNSFIWHAKIAYFSLKKISYPLRTSNRKYRNGNWLKVSIYYQYFWIKQSIPYILKYFYKRIRYGKK